MAIPDTLLKGLRLPLIAAPMFLVSGPDLVVEVCRSGAIGAFPALNARRSEDFAVFQRCYECIGVDDRAACGVDQDGGGLHLREFVLADQMPCFRSERDVECQEVGLAQDSVHVGVFNVVLRRELSVLVLVVGEDPHTEATGAPGDLLTDAAKADDAERGPGDVLTQEE